MSKVSQKKLEKLKEKFPTLTYSVYCHLKDLNVSDLDISKIYSINTRALHNFVKAHYEVLGHLGGK